MSKAAENKQKTTLICGDVIHFDDFSVACDKPAGHPGCHTSLSLDPDDVVEWSDDETAC